MQNHPKMALRYGQIICLFGQNKSRNDANGILQSKGFADNQVYLMNYQRRDFLVNYRQSFFVILPKGKLLIHDELEKLEQYLNSEKNISGKYNQEIPNDLKEQKQNLEERRVNEAEQLNILWQNKCGAPVLYGSEIILKHLDSDAYLTCTSSCVEGSTNSFKVRLRKQLSSYQCFKILSFNAVEKSGNQVMLDNQIYLQSSYYKYFLEINSEQTIYLDKILNLDSDKKKIKTYLPILSKFHIFRPTLKHKQPFDKRLEVAISTNQSAFWQFQAIVKNRYSYYKDYTTDDNEQIQPYDLVEFYHDIDEDILSTRNNEIVLKALYKKEDLYPQNSIWQIEPEFVFKYDSITNASLQSSNNTQLIKNGVVNSLLISFTTIDQEMLQKQDSIQQVPKELEFAQIDNDQFKLRHYKTGKIMTSVSTKEDQVFPYLINDYMQQCYQRKCNSNIRLIVTDSHNLIEDQKQEHELDTKETEIQLLQQYIQMSVDNGDCLINFKNKSFIKIINNNNEELDLLNLREKNNIRNQTIIQKKFRVLIQRQQFHQTKDLVFNPSGDSHPFQIQRIDQAKRKEIQFVESTLELLHYFANALHVPKDQLQSTLSILLINQLKQIIKSLTAFMKNCKKKEIQTTLNQPDKLRQNMIVDYQVHMVILEILNLLQTRNNDLQEALKEFSQKRTNLFDIQQISYTFLEALVHSNSYTKLHLSQFLEFIIEQAININKYQVKQFLQELFKNNAQAVQLFDHNKIKLVLDSIFSFGRLQPISANILSMICVIDDTSLSKNQDEVLQQFFINNKNKSFIFQFKEDQEEGLKVYNYYFDHEIEINQPQLQMQQSQEPQQQTTPQQQKDGEIQLFLNFEQFYLFCQEQKKEQSNKKNFNYQFYNYFIEYLHLMANICTSHNEESINYVRSIFPLNAILKILDSKKNHPGVFTAFIRIVHYAYIVTPILIQQKKIWLWSEICPDNQEQQQQQHQILIDNNHQNIESLIKIVETKISQFAENGFTCYDKQYDQNLSINQEIHVTLLLYKTFLCINIVDITNKNNSRKMKDIIKNMISFLSMKNDLTNQNFSDLKDLVKLKPQDALQKIKTFNNKRFDSKLINLCKVQAATILEQIMNLLTSNQIQEVLKQFAVNQKNNDKQIYDEKGKINEDWYKNDQDKGIGVFQEKIWQDLLNKLTQNYQNMFKFNQMETNWITNINIVFIEMVLFYDDINIINLGQRLFNNFNLRSKKILNILKSTIIAKGQQSIYLNKLVSEFLNNMKLMTNDNSKLLNQKDNEQFRNNIQDNKEQIINSLNSICETLNRFDIQLKIQLTQYQNVSFKANSNQNQSNFSPCTDRTLRIPYCLLCFKSELSENSKTTQFFYTSLDIQSSLIKIINITNNIFSYNKLAMQILQSIYHVLTLLIWNNNSNKQYFIDCKDAFLPHLVFNVGCAEFIRELYFNQKFLLTQKDELPKVIRAILQSCLINRINSYYSSLLFDVLRSFVIYNDIAIKQNQNIVLNCLQEPEFMQLLIFKDPELQASQQSQQLQRTVTQFFQIRIECDEKQIKQWIVDCSNKQKQIIQEALQGEQDEQKLFIVNFSPEITFFVSYFSLFTILTGNDNQITEGVCRKLHPYSYLIPLLESARDAIIVKRTLRAYINGIHYQQGHFYNIFQKIIQSDLKNIEYDLTEYIQAFTNKQQYEKIVICNSPRYQYLYSYMQLNLIDLSLSMNYLFNNAQFRDMLINQLKKNINNKDFELHMLIFNIWARYCKIQYILMLPNQKVQIYELVEGLFKFLDSPLFSQMWNSLHQKACEIINQLDFEFVKKPVNLQKDELKSFCKDTLLPLLKPDLNIIELSNLGQDSVKQQVNELKYEKFKNSSSSFQLFQNKTENKIINKLFKKTIHFINVSKTIQENLNNEIMQLQNNLETIHQCAYQHYKFNKNNQQKEKLNKVTFLTNELYIKALIFININNSDNLFTELRVSFLKTLVKRITSNNNNDKFKSKESQEQNSQMDLGVVNLLCTIIQDSQKMQNSLDFANQSFKLCSVILLGGNTLVQNEFLHQMQQDAKNQIIENLVQFIKFLTKKILINSRLYKQNKSTSFSKDTAITIDNYDYYLQKYGSIIRYQTQFEDTKQEISYDHKCKKVFKRIFRFLQLLCENNNIAIKNFLVKQVNEDGVARTNSIDLIQISIKTLQKMLFMINDKIGQLPLCVADFLNEIVSFQCTQNQQNQKALCQTTFFEDICALQIQLQQGEQMRCQVIQKKQYQRNDDDKIFEKFQNRIHKFLDRSIDIVISIVETDDREILIILHKKLSYKFLLTQIIRHFLTNPIKIRSQKALSQAIANQTDQFFNQHLQTAFNIIRYYISVQKRIPDFQPWDPLFPELENRYNIENLEGILNILQKEYLLILEIAYNNSLHTIHLPKHPVFNTLGKGTRDQIMINIKRSTHREKIIGLLEVKNQVFYEIKHNFKFSQWDIPLTSDNVENWRKITIYISIFLSLFLIICSQYEFKQQSAILSLSPNEMMILQIISIANLEASIILLIIFVINRYTIFYDNYWNQVSNNNSLSNNDKSSRLFKIKHMCLSFLNFLWMDEDFIFLILFVFAAFLGVFYKYTFFFLQLPYVIGRISFMKEVYDSVFIAIFSRLKLLILVFVLGLTYLFVLSIVSYDSYVTQIIPSEQAAQEISKKCQTIYSCMIEFILSGRLGSFKSQTDPTLILIDIFYQIFFMLLFLNIIAGILLDTFARTNNFLLIILQALIKRNEREQKGYSI